MDQISFNKFLSLSISLSLPFFNSSSDLKLPLFDNKVKLSLKMASFGCSWRRERERVRSHVWGRTARELWIRQRRCPWCRTTVGCVAVRTGSPSVL